MCIDVADGRAENGNNIQLYECSENSDNQYFLLSLDSAVGRFRTGRGKIRWALHPTKCLDVQNQLGNNGDNVQLWDCDSLSGYPNYPAQNLHDFYTPHQYGVSGAQQMVWVSGPRKCIVVDEDKFANGQNIQIWDCFNDKAQRFFLSA